MVPFFEITGHIIFRFVGKRDLSLLKRSKERDSNLWHGDSLFSLERWEFWKTRLRWISEQGELMERTQVDAQKIMRLMQEVEQQN
jgi:hypothetical protein